MKSGGLFASFLQRAEILLMSRGYEPIPRPESAILRHAAFIHLAGLRGQEEIILVRLCILRGSTGGMRLATTCAFEICRFRALHRIQPFDLVLRCEIWTRWPNRSVHCYEILPDRIHEVAAYAR